jgi:hypothetical protein
MVWLGGTPEYAPGKTRATIVLPGTAGDTVVVLPDGQARWLVELLNHSTPQRSRTDPYPRFMDSYKAFPETQKAAEAFFAGPVWKKIRAAGLLLV